MSIYIPKELSMEIESVRKQLIELGERLGFLHPEVMRCSEQLDQLLLRYYELERKQRSS